MALLQLGEGKGAPQITEALPLTRQAVRNLARRYQQGGLERALYDSKRPGAASLLTAKQRQRIIAMVCRQGKNRRRRQAECLRRDGRFGHGIPGPYVDPAQQRDMLPGMAIRLALILPTPLRAACRCSGRKASP